MIELSNVTRSFGSNHVLRGINLTVEKGQSLVVIDETGTVLGKYRKTHVPEGANEAGAFCETFYYERSDGDLGSWPANVSRNPFFPVFTTSIGRLAVAIV